MNLYIHKKSGNVYKVIKYGICKDRDVEVVIYTDSQGKYYTREKGEFLKKFVKKEMKLKESTIKDFAKTLDDKKYLQESKEQK